MSKCCSNRIKKLALFLLTIASISITSLGILLYLTGFLRIHDKQSNGQASLTKWHMDYASFSIWISYASYAAAVSGCFGFLAAKVKKPWAACLFVLLAIGSSAVCTWSSTLAIKFRVNN